MVYFDIYLDAHNDPGDWPREYRGQYLKEIKATVNGRGFIKVKAVLGQEIPWTNFTL